MFNELNGPRFNPRKFREGIVTYELYSRWAKKQAKGEKKDLTQFRVIWNLIGEAIVNKVIEERDGVRLPFGLGDFYAGYTRPKKRPIDHKTSNEIGKVVYHENWHTNGKVGKVIYGTKKSETRKYVFSNNKYFGFLPHRDFSRAVSKAVYEHPERYKDSQEKKYLSNGQ